MSKGATYPPIGTELYYVHCAVAKAIYAGANADRCLLDNGLLGIGEEALRDAIELNEFLHEQAAMFRELQKINNQLKAER